MHGIALLCWKCRFTPFSQSFWIFTLPYRTDRTSAGVRKSPVKGYIKDLQGVSASEMSYIISGGLLTLLGYSCMARISLCVCSCYAGLFTIISQSHHVARSWYCKVCEAAVRCVFWLAHTAGLLCDDARKTTSNLIKRKGLMATNTVTIHEHSITINTK